MGHVVVVGGGLIGQCTAMLLAADGHSVHVLERDAAAPPPSPRDAWTTWERRGVNQFRLLHFFLPRFRAVVERELPQIADALAAEGALRFNLIAAIPETISGGFRDGDDRFEALTGRRPMVETVVARLAAGTDGVRITRGVAIGGLLTDGSAAAATRGAVPHVTGVVAEDGTEIRADLVVDASGRRSSLPRWLADVGARPPVEELEDCGFVYYVRHFRSPDGSVPPVLGPPLQHYESVSMLTLPADNGTWGVGITASARDRELRVARHPEVWERIVRSYPLVAHWLEGDPISGVDVMAKIEDRHRSFVVDGTPVATGLVAVGDAWACTNPSVGRGVSIGLLHAVALRDVLRARSLDDRVGFALAFHDATQETVEPYYRDTLALDRHRLAQMHAEIAGEPYETDDPGWLLGETLAAAAGSDPELLRAFVAIAGLLERGVDVLARPGVAERALELAGRAPDHGRLPGPSRAELLTLVEA